MIFLLPDLYLFALFSRTPVARASLWGSGSSFPQYLGGRKVPTPPHCLLLGCWAEPRDPRLAMCVIRFSLLRTRLGKQEPLSPPQSGWYSSLPGYAGGGCSSGFGVRVGMAFYLRGDAGRTSSGALGLGPAS